MKSRNETFKALKVLVTITSLLICVACAPDISNRISNVSLDDPWDVTIPKGKTRSIGFSTSEGTYMSVSPAPDESWVSFDLLGHIYRLGKGEESAISLTQTSGVSLNFHPAVSPDGKKIAFISDRSGQDGIWTMDSDGNNPQLLFVDPDVRFTDPVWMPDGKGIIAVRHSPTPGRGWHRRNTKIWLFPSNGEEPRELLGGTATQYNSPSISSDGRWLYFHQSYFSGNRFGTQSGYHIRRMELSSGQIEVISNTVTPDITPEDFKVASEDTMPMHIVSEFAPEISPNGRFLAFGRELDGESTKHKNHQFRPATGLFLRDLKTGQETFLAKVTKDLTSAHGIYSYRVMPGYGWSQDSKAIFFSEGGKIRRLEPGSVSVSEIPFTAKVKREISERVRGKVTFDDDSVQSRYLQWPVSSPDTRSVAFIAFGQLWLADASTGKAKVLVLPDGKDRLLTPAFSRDGTKIFYTSWDDQAGGKLWQYELKTRRAIQINVPVAKYIYPVVSKDGASLYLNRGDRLEPWLSPKNWELIEVNIVTQKTKPVISLPYFQNITEGDDGRLYYQYQREAHTVSLYEPYPDYESLSRRVILRSVDTNGQEIRDHVSLPAIAFGSFTLGSDAQLSPDGQWLTYVSSSDVYLAEVAKLPKTDDGLSKLVTDPNIDQPGVKRLTELGGKYPKWQSAEDLEWVSGHRYQLYNTQSGTLKNLPIIAKTKRAHGKGKLAFKNAKLITLNGDEVLEHADLLIEDSRITCVGECDISDDVKVIDATNKVIVPGFVDVHAHNAGEGQFTTKWTTGKLNLAYGVTTTVDPAILSQSLFPLSEMVEAGSILGPRTFGTAEIVTKPATAFGDTLDVSSFNDALRNVRRRADWGAVSIKNFRLTSRRANQQLIEAARESGLTITGEGGPLYFDIGFAMDGQTGWEHTIAHLPIYSDVATFFGKAGVVYSPTIVVAGHRGGSMDYFRPRHNFKADHKYLSFLEPAQREYYKKIPPLEIRPIETFAFPIQAQGLADIIRAGGRGAIGEHAEQPGLGHHWEIWSYATALTPLEALRVAALDGAWFIGMDHEIGSIEPGKLADLVILNSDPLKDIKNTLDIEWVMKQGLLFDGDNLNRIWPD